MDIGLAKTFLEIANTGSFVAASERLNITQTAVSARIKALEEQLGQQLFVRNKSGAKLTSAGERFIRHATTLVQVWERARQQVDLPSGRTDIASVGAELSLWNPLLVDWLVWMKQQAPDVALRADVDIQPRLLERLHNGSLDLALLYNPPPQGGQTIVELLIDEKLIMVTTNPNRQAGAPEDYVDVDWGASFHANRQAALPHITHPGVLMSHGPSALAYLARAGGTGYFRLSALRDLLREGVLHRVEGAPEFSYSVHMVHSRRAEPALMDRMRAGFKVCVTHS